MRSRAMTLAMFMDRVSPEPNSGCWLWLGTFASSTGYGLIARNGKRIGAHRWIVEELRGPVANGLFICHRCDNPACVNPDHLFVGTPRENMLDRERKGRSNAPRGSGNGAAGLTEQQVLAIRAVPAGEATQRQLAARFGIRQSTISRILSGEIWGHV